MKKYKNKLIAVLISTFALLSFTSCETDSYWTEGTLDYPAQLKISPSGTFSYDVRIDESWLVVRGAGKYPDIRDLRFLDGQLDIYLSNRGTGLDWLELGIDGTDVGIRYSSISYPGIVDDSRMVRDFLSVMTDQIARYGSVVIYVDGEGSRGANFDINFGMDLDVYVRE
jgi:hypothetical protein